MNVDGSLVGRVDPSPPPSCFLPAGQSCGGKEWTDGLIAWWPRLSLPPLSTSPSHDHVWSSPAVQGPKLHRRWRPAASPSKVGGTAWQAWVPRLFPLLPCIPLCQDPLGKCLAWHFLSVPTASTLLGCRILVEGVVVMLLGCLGRSRWS
jgi:hypothetical protein